MKKYRIAVALCIALVLALAGCGSSDSTEKKETDSVEKQEQEVETEKETEEAKPETKEEESTEEASALPAATDFSQVIVDQNDVKFEIKEIDESGLWGYTWNVYLENNTDKTLMFSVDEVSVNGVMIDPFWANEVEPGKKSNSEISWSSTSLEEVGINAVTAVEFVLRISDSEDIFADPIVEDVFTVYPYGESEAVTMEREESTDDLVLFDNDDCTMIITGCNPDGLFGFELNAYIENKTDKTLMFSIENASINGFMADPLWASSIAPGKKSTEDITWMSSTLEENGIDKVETIEMTVNVYNDDDWEDQILNEVFTVNFE